MEIQVIEKENACDSEPPTSPRILKPKPLNLKRRTRKVQDNTPVLRPLNQNIPSSRVRSITSFYQSPINPFRCNDKKRKRETTADVEENSLLWRWTNNKIGENSSNTIETCDTIPFPSPVTPSVVNEDAQLDFSDGKHFLYSEQNKNVVPSKLGHKDLPVDWSIKTRIRLSSTKPFPWRSSFKTSEEASGTTAFVRCLHNDSKKRYTLDSSHGAKFYQNCLVWMHPHLPWLNMFPRMKTNTLKKVNSTSVQLDSSVKETLHSNWCVSFRSLYQLVRTCQCPFFYLCAPTFTVLFRSGGVASILDIHALITPTTTGLRNALKNEGINFTMPFQKVESTNAEKKPYEAEENGEFDADDLDAAEDGGIEKWLDDLGITKDYLPLVNRSRAELENEKFKHIDNRPESLVFVEAAETQALVNFLLNSQICLEKIGPMAGIPPTLLSPTAFLGATLQSHKICPGAQNVRGEYMVELHGPILPNTVHSLCSLLNSTQDGNFSAVLTHHPPTVAFSTMTTSDSAKVPSVFATENLKDCGLPNVFIQQMCAKNTLKGGLTRLCVEDGLFSWS